MRSEDILARIDSTLDDWTVSDDAMRSRPGGEMGGVKGFVPQLAIMDEVAAPRFWIAPVGTPVEADGWEEVGYITDADFAIDQSIDPAALQPAPTVTWQEISDYIAEIQAERARRAQAVLDALTRALTEVVKPAAEAAALGLAQLQQASEQAAPPLPTGRRHDRPAWQSPYGPPQRRR